MKTGESVIINKPNHIAHGLGGNIVSINEETKRIRVDLNGGGEWGFNYSEVLATGGQNKPIEAIKPKEMGIVSTEKIKSVKSTEKRPYTKRGSKPVDDKPKRKYSPRKPKTI